MKTKAPFENSRPVWKELRPCGGECVKEAARGRRDDTGLKAEQQRAVVRRMNSDWRSAQWQLNDLRSVDSVSINQTALSCSPTFFFFFLLPPAPLGSNFCLCPQPRGRKMGALFSLSLSPHLFCFVLLHLCLCFSISPPSPSLFL